ncbi:hypothetical protein PY793_07690 [Acetobacter fabarum]|uniref:hypothetical protein n=1 Tax=Acetobacter fabarum TaxID=483199 RepID=UPI00312B3C36
MADTGQNVPAVGSVTRNTAKVAAIIAFIPSFFSVLPQNVALVICAGMVTCAAITAAVPAPVHGRVLVALYQIVRVTGLGVQYAVPYMASHLVKATSASKAYSPVPATATGGTVAASAPGTGANTTGCVGTDKSTP